MCFNPGPERRVPSPNRYIADTKFCFYKNNKRIIIIKDSLDLLKFLTCLFLMYQRALHVSQLYTLSFL
jgi:hypothetical protein